MPIFLGQSKIKDVFLGSSKIKELYLGTSKIYSSFPQGYTKYDYLISKNANANAYTEIGMFLNVTSTTLMDVVATSATSSVHNIWGYSNTTGTRVYYGFANNEFGLGTGYTISAAKDIRHNLKIERNLTDGKLTLTIDGETSVSANCASNPNKIYIGTQFSSASAGYIKYYSVKVYDGYNKLIRDLVPAKNSSSDSGFVNLAYKANDADSGSLWYASNNNSTMYAENDV